MRHLASFEQVDELWAGQLDLGIFQHVTEVYVGLLAATILFLASAANTVTRGAVVPVYGKS